jgi:hypothetical protein
MVKKKTVNEYKLTPDQYLQSSQLREWARRNKNSKVISNFAEGLGSVRSAALLSWRQRKTNANDLFLKRSPVCTYRPVR